MAMKRTLDIFASAVGLVVAAPLMAVTATLVRVRLGRPVLFRQIRPGLNEIPFTVIKFRTMREAASADGQPLPDEQRLGRLGRFLRRASLDELPQLWNVLMGNMSLVGPRPLLMEYLPRYSPDQRRRHDVRPGLTGLAQVRGRNQLSWPERFALDVWYIDNWTLWLDLRILASTAWMVVSGRGVSQAGRATADEFRGGA